MNIVVNGDVVIYENTSSKKSVKDIRVSSQLSKVKQKVKSRDGLCQCCGEDANGHLEVHHILPVAKYKDLACDMNNMISLCQKCHAKYHDLYPQVNAVTFSDYMKRYANRRG